MKAQRWYEIINGIAYIYEAPFSKDSPSVSIVSVDQLSYYRKTFKLNKVWSEHA